jgi:hypothetical protein
MVAIDFTVKLNATQEQYDFFQSDVESILEKIQRTFQVSARKKCLSSEYQIPVYGYGAKLIPQCDTISQCFAVNGKIFAPEVLGAQNLVAAFKDCVKEVT